MSLDHDSRYNPDLKPATFTKDQILEARYLYENNDYSDTNAAKTKIAVTDTHGNYHYIELSDTSSYNYTQLQTWISENPSERYIKTRGNASHGNRI